MNSINILFAGFGGQGILFAGKFLAYKGMLEGKEVSWLPSYGPEMRGGTANCSVIISDEPIGSPIVDRPDALVVMNLPSLDRYEDIVLPGGSIFVDSALIERKVKRTDVNVYYIPASTMADQNKMSSLANMIITGKVMREMPYLATGSIDDTLGKIVSARHQDRLKMNTDALRLGMEYEG